MARLATLELARENLFVNKSELEKSFGAFDIDRIMKVRAMYMWRMEYPEAKDREFLEEFRARYPEAGKNVAHEYMVVVNSLLPMLSDKTKDFHRWRYNEMILDTYRIAKEKGDTKTMERAATSYAKNNKVDEEDLRKIPWEKIIPPRIVPTMDPTVLGIKPIPDLDSRIKALIDRYSKEISDIDDVEYEELDLEEEQLFAPYIDGDSEE